MKRDKFLIIALTVAILLLLGLFVFQLEKTKEALALTNSLTDELEVVRDEKGRETAKISVITAENEKALLRLKSKDSIIIWLQSTIKDYEGKLNTAIVLRNETESKGTSETKVIRDTIRMGGETKIAEYYETKWSNKWEEGYILARPDSIHRTIKVKNDYQITLGSVSNGWFKPKEYEVQILNLNPNTSTQELRTFQVKEKPKRLAVGLFTGYGVGLVDFKPQPFVGVGVQYNIISIK